MKIALMFIGLCRPKVEYCIENIKALKESFCTYDVDTYLTDYNSEFSRELSNHVDNLILTKRESDEFIDSLFPDVKCINAQRGWIPQTNIWRLRRKINYTLKFIESTEIKYDYLVYSRPCTKVVINPEEWLHAEDNWYNVFNAGRGWIDDRFALARPEIMKQVWGYDNKEIFNIFQGITNDETFVGQMCIANNVKVRTCQAYVELRKAE